MKNRIAAFSSALQDRYAFYAADPSDVFYLCGFSGTFGRIVALEKKAYFITDPRYAGTPVIRDIAKTFEVVITKDFSGDLKKILKNVKKTGLSRQTPLAEYLNLKNNGFSPEIDDRVREARMVKDKHEVELIKKAVSINEAGIRHVVSILKPGITEKEIALEFDIYIRKHGADSVSFPSIVAFNASGAVPHHATSSARLHKNTLILIDCGVRYQGYCSDLTRCIAFCIIKSRFNDIVAEYELTRAAKASAVLNYTNGKNIKDADLESRQYLERHKRAGYFTHALGHGIGIDIHEQPSVNKTATGKFLPGMVLTCEPGLYYKEKYGIRIEDDYLVTRDNPVKLGSMNDGLIIKE
ncbi:MAG: Xaa-Pro peptidase family protein [Spirochaetia bacterium]|nr:Xaa-Pro peptidase family protein [Spirochaetia bacterium]